MKSALALPAVILILGLAVIPVDAGAAENEPDQGVLRKRVERLSESEDPSIEGARIAALSFIESFYQQRAFDLAWRDGANRDVLLAAIAASPNDGLNPKDFHV